QGAVVYVSVTSLNGDLARELEPRASQPSRRLSAIDALAKAGIPAGVLVAPVIPGLTDHEMPSILQAAADAGACIAAYVLWRLPYGLAQLFEEWFALHASLQKEKILGRIREMRSGKLNDPNFGSRMRADGPYADHMRKLFEVSCRKSGFNSASRS